MSALRVAIVGMAGRFPRARDLDEFWQNLAAGVHAVSFFSDSELLDRGVPPATLQRPDFVKAGGVLEDAASFDAALFGYSPRDAELLDPQQRLFLECAWAALENAGYPPGDLAMRAGVFASCGIDTYLMANLANNPEALARAGMDQVRIANRLDNIATRVSYKLNLTGPSLAVQTGCSSSLVAVHLACQSLLSGECDIALGGGVRFSVARDRGYHYVPGGVLSPDGCCRTFDARAQGMVGGDGVGIVVLRREADALRDGDYIRAVILGSAVNNDGNRKVGYTAPSPHGQAQVISEALAVAGVAAESISHIEAHGTATALGDPIEVAALKRVFGAERPDAQPIALSSVKTFVGHLDAASGVVGLIKCVLELEQRRLAPNLHFERPHPALDLDGSRLRVVQHATDWTSSEPRRAGVSSFGIGGTNAHVIVEEARPRVASRAEGPHLLVFSAATAASLHRQIENVTRWLSTARDFSDAAFTLATGRKALAHRAFAVCADRDDALRRLSAHTLDRNDGDCRRRSIVFLFPGQGSQHAGIGKEVYRREPLFRRAFDDCAERLRGHLGVDLRTLLFEEESGDNGLDATDLCQPAVFAVSWSLATLLMSWGVSPAAVAGHSLGELTAACIAGVFSLDDALRVVAARGRIMAALPRGGMSSVALPVDEVAMTLPRALSIAAVNAPDLCTVAGDCEALASWEEEMRGRGVVCRRLRTNHAFHTPSVARARPAFRDVVAQVERRPPRLAILSNVTGSWLTADEAIDPDYWTRQMCEPVQFADGAERLWSLTDPVFVEVGPGDALSTFVRRSRRRVAGGRVRLTLGRAAERDREHTTLLETTGGLWASGVSIDWQTATAGWGGRRTPLPSYPFDRQRFYIEPSATSAAAEREPRTTSVPQKWLYVPSWQRLPRAARAANAQRVWMLLGFDRLVEPLAQALHASGERTQPVRSVADLRSMTLSDQGPKSVVYVIDPGGVASGSERRMFAEVLELARVAAQARNLDAVFVVSPSSGASVTGEEPIVPEIAAVAGLLKVVPQEYPHVAWRFIDCGDVRDISGRTIDELLAAPAGPLVAFRGAHRWAPRYERMQVDAGAPPNPGTAWIVTGGTGRIGLAIARRWAVHGVRLVLTSRTTPAPDTEAAGALDGIVRAGGEVIHVAADAADEASMGRAFDLAEARFGRIDGVIHAAGLTRVTRDLASLDWAAFNDYFRPKVDGARVLASLLRARHIPVCVVMSSLSAVLGGLGYGAHAAANAVLDAFAARMNRDGHSRWISINWDGWDFGGSAGSGALIPPGAGVELLERIVGSGESHVLVSVSDLDARIGKWIRHEATTLSIAEAPPIQTRPPAPASESESARSEAERRIASIWEDLLGVRRVAVDDDFFELGGHSLLAVRVAARLREEFDVVVSARVVLENPTIGRLAAAVADALTAEIAAMSDAEVQSLLGSTDSHA